MSLVHRERPPAGGADPAGALVLLHGRGTDENDLFPLLDELDPERRLLGVTARGLHALPPGGWHWYAVRRIGFPDPATFAATWPRLTAWLDGLLAERGIEHRRAIVGGFSQGAVMAWALTLAAGRPTPAGVAALSGFIPTVEGLEVDLTGRSGLRAAIAHGTYDSVIGPEWGREARDRLSAAGADVLFRETPIPHAVDPRVLPELARWVDLTLDLSA